MPLKEQRNICLCQSSRILLTYSNVSFGISFFFAPVTILVATVLTPSTFVI